MKNILLCVAFFCLACLSAYAASGDKPNQMVIPFRNVSSAIKPTGCVVGEMKQNADYIFNCSSSSHWRRVTKGVGF